MSDYEYEEEYQYDEPDDGQMVEENVETTLEFENFQAEELLREHKVEEALNVFQTIYEKANDNNIASWKSKALNQILEIYLQKGNDVEARKTLIKIKEMNEVDKTNEQSVKSIIKTFGTVDRKMYESFWNDIFGLILSLDDPEGQLKCYFFMFEKEIESKNLEKSRLIFEKIREARSKTNQLTPALELELSYLEILYLKLHGESFNDKLTVLYNNLPRYEEDTNVNEAYLSKIKESISEILFKEENYNECANFLCGCFIENSKYGSNSEKNKQLLKINVLTIFLCGNISLFEDYEFNPLLQESTAIFKVDPDIQGLYGLIEAFKEQDIQRFEEIIKVVDLKVERDSAYAQLERLVILEMKKEKLISVCQTYKTIRFDYIFRRINEKDERVLQDLLLKIITSGKVNGVIHLEEKYLEMVPEENRYYTVQLENLHDLTKRM